MTPPDGETLDAAYVVARLEEAGMTLLCLPDTGPSTRLVLSQLAGPMLADAAGWTRDYAPLRPQVYSPARVSRMDEAMSWLRLIPDDRFVLRRIVGARSLGSRGEALASPELTGRHLFPWRRIGLIVSALEADRRQVRASVANAAMADRAKRSFALD